MILLTIDLDISALYVGVVKSQKIYEVMTIPKRQEQAYTLVVDESETLGGS